MLKRLELIGFKSFADKTRFDFSPGVTAVVGPNGSGKSNIVDAVKWILGEQSAKSLRGGEMADVIFNGSTTRKSLGMAEVTMTFDNGRRQIKFDGDEVEVTRRVYRDGQGEYLINGTIARLKDIKEMFLGSGAGQGAYSIIEQGRVDALLVASTKDRRHIFEEASGISRFRADKLETLRKLDHVHTNLTRVRDNLEQKTKNLQILSGQAAKAQKYQEHHAKLKELRIAVGFHEYRELLDTLTYQEGVLKNLQDAVREATQKTETGETTLRRLDEELNEAEKAWRAEEKQLGDAQRQIAELHAAMKSGREQAANLQDENLKLGKQRTDITIRLSTLDTELARITSEIATVRDVVEAEQAKADAAGSALNVVTATIAELTRQAQQDRENQFEIVRRAGESRAATEMNRTQVERLRLAIDRNTKDRSNLMAKANAIAAAIEDLSRTDADLQQKLQTARSGLLALQQQQTDLRKQAEQLQPELDNLREQRSALNARHEVLANLESSQEGIGAGVQAVLAKLPTPGVLGLVADLLTVPREIAPLVDIALGERAQQFAIQSVATRDVLHKFAELPGRVGFLPLQASVDSHSHGGLPSLASLVQSTIPGLVDQLLGDVCLLDDHTNTEALRQQNPHLRFLTRNGELWDRNGTITVGPARAELGIVSRKSELRELREQLVQSGARILHLETQQAKYRQEADTLQAPMAGHETTIQTLSGEANDLRKRIDDQQRTRDDLQSQTTLLTKESEVSMKSLQEADQAWQNAKHLAEVAELEDKNLKQRLAQADEQLRLAEANRVIRQDENTTAQVALTRVKQQLATLQSRCSEWEKEQRQRTTELDNIIVAESTLLARITDCQLATLRATDSAAHSHGNKERHQLQSRQWTERRDVLRAERDCVQEELKTYRTEWESRTNLTYSHKEAMKDFLNRRDNIAEKIREDYQLELATIAEVPPLSQPLDEMQEEINALKRKIQKLGNVNLEALEQLEKEEAEEKRIRKECDDLDAAEKSLLEIIETINVESRKAFGETLDTIRGHFQELFRKLFGGGMADIVLEDPTDVLETGIEITARPPGKELRSISLLSGGEKTMTAIALLLAIFRSKPSPFCLLDEVDAALDEANTARLADIINEFREKSQFIIVTHKKRTMAMADVLHGVTMQESGVSKQVATRIEDWEDEPQPTDPQSTA